MLFNQYKEDRAVVEGPIVWEKFKVAFSNRFFPVEMTEAKVLEFINLHQGDVTVEEYTLKFTQLSRYFLNMVVVPRARMSKFVPGAFILVVKFTKLSCLLR